MHKYIIMGPQGCGKGTQANQLKSSLGLIHISVGDMLRWNIQSHTKLAARIQRIMAEGRLVPDEIVEELIKRRLDEHDWNYGFILDGFPRNRPQAEFFLESYDIDAVILINVPDQIVLERLLSRRLCLNCNLDYNLIFHRPIVADTCDVCKGRLIQREDDREDVVRTRLQDYHERTLPIIDLFRNKELVVEVDGTKKAVVVQEDILKQLNLQAV